MTIRYSITKSTKYLFNCKNRHVPCKYLNTHDLMNHTFIVVVRITIRIRINLSHELYLSFHLPHGSKN